MTIATLDYPTPPGIVAFSTMRSAESPALPYSGFNVCHYTGDSSEHINKCRRQLCKHLGISTDRLIIPHQTHSDRVAVIRSLPIDAELIESTDALVTNISGVALAINTADCVPVLLFDPDAGTIAAVHSGWRGTDMRIAAKTVKAMTELGANIERLHAVMGPSICRDCFEVGEEVALHFRHGFSDTTVTDRIGRRPHVDLGEAIRSTLLDCGLKADNISVPPVCSKCNSDRFFSARRLGVASGRTLSVICNIKNN